MLITVKCRLWKQVYLRTASLLPLGLTVHHNLARSLEVLIVIVELNKCHRILLRDESYIDYDREIEALKLLVLF